MKRIAVLDDYLHTAEDSADWASIPGSEITFFHDTLLDPDELVDRLAPFDAVMTTRDRTFFPPKVL